eukprot:scaffold180880_cov18-Tisochrysis_lutea.AAC.1
MSAAWTCSRSQSAQSWDACIPSAASNVARPRVEANAAQSWDASCFLDQQLLDQARLRRNTLFGLLECVASWYAAIIPSLSGALCPRH